MTRLVLRSLAFYWRSHLGVFAGTLLAAAVLTGALLVGDSVAYSLETFAMMRLGGVRHALDSRSQLVGEPLAARLEAAAGTPVAAVLRLRGMAIAESDSAASGAQVNNVEVHGVTAAFWKFGKGQPLELAPYETALSSRLAEALGVGEGGSVSLRVAKPSLMARDSPLSSRDEERSIRNRYTVKRVLADNEMGRFGLSPSQTAPYNAFVNLPFLQEQVEMAHKANLLLMGEGIDGEALDTALRAAWRLDDLGLKIRTCSDGIVQLESERIFLTEEISRAALSLPGAHGTLTYLATSMKKGDKLTPYFFVVAGALATPLRDDEIIINRWMANELGAAAGDHVTLDYAELLPNNKFRNAAREFTVHSVVEMESLTAEKERMPVFPGLSDVESCSDWDVGMPMDDALLNDKANEEYWKTYRETPKAFVSLAVGQAMWANRFGNLSAVRFPANTPLDTLAESMRQAADPTLAGLFFVPVGEQALEAVSEAMDFGGLFLGMSFFLIIAAIVLTALLFVFGVQQRAAQMGILGALGFRRRQVRRLLLTEGAVVALGGALAGAFAGTLYTRALLFGLGRYWGGAVANATVLYHAEPATVISGGAATFVCALLAMAVAIRKLSGETPRDLLNLDFGQPVAAGPSDATGKRSLYFSLTTLALSLAAVLYAFLAGTGEVAPVFFGAGALLLLSGLAYFRHHLLRLAGQPGRTAFTLRTLAVLNLTRRPGRSLAVAGVLASGCFLVFAVSAMQEDVGAHAMLRSSGTGGFAILAESTFPILEDPAAQFEDPNILATAIKVRDGDDASCLNLNHAQSPRVLGVDPAGFASRDAFTAAAAGGAFWGLLNETLPGGEIPALVGDTNTSMWTLKKKVGPVKGDVLIYKNEAGEEVRVKLVGQLPMRLSLFQGSLLISQEAFTRIFPSEDGYRMFLIDMPEERRAAVMEKLRKQYDRFGLNAVPAVERLREFAVVESTYLAMFLVLGGLGMVIGSLGMAVVVLRNLHERRAEIAMLSALGFDRRRRRRAYLMEYGVLLTVGLGIGGLSAGLALLPALSQSETSLSVATLAGIAALVIAAYAGCLNLALSIPLRRTDFSPLRSE